VEETVRSTHRPDRRVHELAFPQGLPFSAVEKHVITYERAMTPEQICAMYGTYSAIISLAAEERNALLGRLLDHLEARVTEHSGRTFAVPFVATCYRTWRLG
jgi:hypothetical protein